MASAASFVGAKSSSASFNLSACRCNDGQLDLGQVDGPHGPHRYRRTARHSERPGCVISVFHSCYASGLLLQNGRMYHYANEWPWPLVVGPRSFPTDWQAERSLVAEQRHGPVGWLSTNRKLMATATVDPVRSSRHMTTTVGALDLVDRDAGGNARRSIRQIRWQEQNESRQRPSLSRVAAVLPSAGVFPPSLICHCEPAGMKIDGRLNLTCCPRVVDARGSGCHSCPIRPDTG
jgi:hypothetical protein